MKTVEKNRNSIKTPRTLSIKRLTHQLFTGLPKLITKNRGLLVAVAIFLLATVLYAWPTVRHVNTYSDGGDHMFNAWTLARDQNCILRKACSNYATANIFFPHADSMLYSETQFSTGLLTLPLRLVSSNPLFSANVWYLLSIFMSGMFMYLLTLNLSKGNQAASIMSGLLFEFAPNKISSMTHLQNLSIFYLPLIILLILKYRDTGQRKYLALTLISSSLMFLASWYQMVFGLIVIGFFLIFVGSQDRRRGLLLALAVGLAVLSTAPLAKEYVRFSKANKASFSISSQVDLSAGVYDYFLPAENSIAGTLFYKLNPHTQRNAYSKDSYSYAGLTLYAVLASCLFLFLRKSNRDRERRKLTILLACVFVVGLVFSLGPLIKIGSKYVFEAQNIAVVIPVPYLLVDKFLPQLSFIRAVGRASVICLFALCCSLAVFAAYVSELKPIRKYRQLLALVLVAVFIDIVPIAKLISTPTQPIEQYKKSYTIPAVYKFIKQNQKINNIVILRSKPDYAYAAIPTAPVEDVLWAGYHNRNIFNGYSGYEPPVYRTELRDYQDLKADDVPKMKANGLQYVLVDEQLSDPRNGLVQEARHLFSTAVYKDNRYALYKIQP